MSQTQAIQLTLNGIKSAKGVQNAVLQHYIGSDQAIAFCNLYRLPSLVSSWTQALPAINPYHSVRSASNHQIINSFKEKNFIFMCSNKLEIKLLVEEHQISPSKIIFVRNVYTKEILNFLKISNINLLTIDSEFELQKVKSFYPTADILLSFLPSETAKNSKSLCVQFGSSLEQGKLLVTLCKKLNLNLVGISLNTGDRCQTEKMFVSAMQETEELLDMMKTEGFLPRLLDIGYGIPDVTDNSFLKVALTVESSLSNIKIPHMQVIGDCGRSVASHLFTLAVQVLSKRSRFSDVNYYMSDGTYGLLNSFLRGRTALSNHPYRFYPEDIESRPTQRCIMYGPTCDSTDKICNGMDLPKLNIGDWLVIEGLGCESLDCLCTFNRIPQPMVFYLTEDICVM